MVKILVVTDELKKWSLKFHEEIKINKVIKRRGELSLYSDTFVIDIIERVHISMRGRKYNYCILDKEIDSALEHNVVKPFVLGEIDRLYLNKENEEK